VKQTIITITLYFLPTAILSSVGILILVFQRAGFDIVFGILVLIFAVMILTVGIILQNVLRAQARQVKLQTDFVAKVSHELRTPLASIRMFVDTLRDSHAQDPDETALCLDVISTETSRLSSMIERLLSWGRMESGRRTYEMRPELAATLVGEALAQLEPQLQSSKVEVELELVDESAAVLADRQALVEALLNLMSNAVKYGAGRLTVRVSIFRQRKVRIDVEDNGPGIPRKEQRRVFEKFYRGSAQLVARTAGSGLGLAMARLIVKAHKGKLRLWSQLGTGTRFTVELRKLKPGRSAIEVPKG
jgi:two-component system, OmpR family, phosphate regulon sensor histidine kinase PhoR